MRAHVVMAFAICLLFALAACATTPKPPAEPTIIYRTVNVPVPVSCIDKGVIPSMPEKVGADLNGDAAHDLDVVSASAIRLRSALDQALALLGGCAK